MPTRILVIGRSGQLADALMRLTPPAGVVLTAAGRDQFDLSDLRGIGPHLRAFAPSAIINAAAHTAVDKAESEPQVAFALNRDGPARLARECADLDIPLIHVSTDYVFDGRKDAPYIETDAKNPTCVYGRSKSEGEDAVLATGAHAAILRTSWVYAARGSNFLRTMLRLAQTREEINVVSDQIGRPTWARDLAEACLAVALRAHDRDHATRGVLHYAGAGDATWADFAEAIFAEAKASGLKTASVNRITTAEYPTPAKRPANSRLDTTKIESVLGVRPRDWREAVRACVREVAG